MNADKDKEEEEQERVERQVDAINKDKGMAFDYMDQGHVALLEELCKSLQVLDKEWGRLGFQGKDPATDFRGMGVLGLKSLVYFAVNHTDIALDIVQENVRDPLKSPGYAITGINLAFDAYRIITQRQFDFLISPKSGVLNSYHSFFAAYWIRFHKHWKETRPNSVMEFEAERRKVLEKITRELKWNAIWLWIVGVW